MSHAILFKCYSNLLVSNVDDFEPVRQNYILSNGAKVEFV